MQSKTYGISSTSNTCREHGSPNLKQQRETSREIAEPTETAKVVLLDLIAGSLAGATGCIAGHPIDVVKTRLQDITRSNFSPSTRQCVSSMLKNEGFRSFWRGLSAPLCGVGAYQAVLFASYNGSMPIINNFLSQYGSSESMSSSNSLIKQTTAGLVAGFMTTLVTTPCDFVKIQMQVQTGSVQTSKFKSSFHCAQQVLRNGGIRGLYRGWYVTLLRDVPSAGLQFVMYEECKKLFRQYMGKQVEYESNSVSNMIQAGPGFPELISGGFAGVIRWGSTIPFDVIKTNIQAASIAAGQRAPKATEVSRRIFTQSGWRGFIKGILPLTLRGFWVNAIIF